jgi:hypothetical protein
MPDMGVVESWLRARVQRPTGADRLAQALRADPATGLAQLTRFLAALPDREPSAEVRLGALEPLRPAWRPAVAASLDALRHQPLPLDADQLAAFHRAAGALHALRDAYQSIHSALGAADAGASDAPTSPRALLALARALDAQSRLLVGACTMRVAPSRDEWDRLCRLALPLCASSALDEAFPEPTAQGGARPSTPRAAIVLPLLLRLLEPLGLSRAELDLAAMIAHATGRDAGVRIDADGRPRVSAEGPAMMLSARHTVRLDTRLVLAWIRRARERLSGGRPPPALGLRTLLSGRDVEALLGRLEGVWAPGHVPTPLSRPPLTRALLHVGLPRRLRPGDAPDAAVAVDPVALPVYTYGDRRAAAGPAPVDDAGRRARETAVRALMAAAGAPVSWRGQDARRSVFARAVAEPRLRLGQLVAVLPHRANDPIGRGRAARPGDGQSRLLVGRVVTLAHTGVPGGREPFGHDVGIAFWPGHALPVRVRFDGSHAFEDAWWTPAEGASAGVLVLRRDRFEAPSGVLVREPAGDRWLRTVRLVERGADHDRVEVAQA